MSIELQHNLTDGLAAVFGVNGGLIEEADLLVIALQTGFDDLLKHVGGLAGVLLAQHVLLALNHRRVHARSVESQRAGGGHVQSDLAGQSTERGDVALGFQRDQHADLALAFGDRVVHVHADDAVSDLRRSSRWKMRLKIDGSSL